MRLVLANGVFDLLHVAHIAHLEEARKMGDCLVIGLTTDASAAKEKRMPIFDEAERMQMLTALRCVSAVSLCRDSLEALRHWNPQVFVKGADRKARGLLPAEIAYCNTHGIEIAFTQPHPLHTSHIIERIKICEFS